MTADAPKDIEAPETEPSVAIDRMRALDDASEPLADCAIVTSPDRWSLDLVATHILAFEGESKVTFFDGTARAGVRWARRGLPRIGQRRRGRGRVVPIASSTRGQRSRHCSEYEEWRKQQLGDAATRPHRITYRKLTRSR